MDPFSMVVAIVFIGSVAGVVHKALETGAGRRKNADRQYLEGQLAEMRKEMTELKAWASDLVLSFDSTLQHQNTRLHLLERQALGDGRPASQTGIASREAPVAPEAVEVRTRA